jgi:hypothetical protein
MRVREAAPKPDLAGQRLWAEARAGFQLVLGSAVLRPLIGSTGWVTFWSHVLEAAMLLYLVRGLGLAPGQIGVILAVSNVGLLAGGELLAALWLLTSPVRALRELPEPVAD